MVSIHDLGSCGEVRVLYLVPAIIYKGVHSMFSLSTRKLMLENRLARLSANGKENGRIRGKILRQLRKI